MPTKQSRQDKLRKHEQFGIAAGHKRRGRRLGQTETREKRQKRKRPSETGFGGNICPPQVTFPSRINLMAMSKYPHTRRPTVEMKGTQHGPMMLELGRGEMKYHLPSHDRQTMTQSRIMIAIPSPELEQTPGAICQ